MASRNTYLKTKAVGLDLHPETDEAYMADRFGWTEPPYFDEDPEERDYRLAALPEWERVAADIGPEYAGWNDDLLNYWEAGDMHRESQAYQLENYTPTLNTPLP